MHFGEFILWLLFIMENAMELFLAVLFIIAIGFAVHKYGKRK